MNRYHRDPNEHLDGEYCGTHTIQDRYQAVKACKISGIIRTTKERKTCQKATDIFYGDYPNINCIIADVFPDTGIKEVTIKN